MSRPSPHSPRASRSLLLRRLPMTPAAGALALATAVAPAAASDAPDDGDPSGWSQQGGNGDGGTGEGNHDGVGGNDGGNDGHQAGGNHGDHGRYKDVGTAQSLALRTSPDRGAKVIRYAHKGDVASIYCKVGGDDVQGNPLWYLLTDGTWAWGAARHIDNIGPAPRWR
ncbi:SH3 domain-containing protein [Streptomyces sp. NPDC005774]|uniref:SH3 domain-containing protein n=1 Tax=Streptomyces sp. NPDC005774 TaxID=3364728 RepID=UPI0036CFDB99